jgi:glycerol dehydrogenase
MGDGETLDAAKAVACSLGAPVVVIPTVACVNAPTSVRFSDRVEGGPPGGCCASCRPPDLVLVDTQVIADAPARTFLAAVGHALATWFEARAAAQSYATTTAGGWQTLAAGALARACWETLRRYAPEAITAVRAHRVTDAVEKVVEVTTLMSGLGSESGGRAAAHAIGIGLSALPETRRFSQGEKVAFGVLAQLELERRTEQDRRDVLAFCLTVGLPVCFADLGLPDITPAQIARVVEHAMNGAETIYNEPRALTPETVMDALRSADARGQAAKAAVAVAACAC